MKKRAGFIPVFLAVLALLGGCTNLLDPPGGGGGGGPRGKGRIEVQVEGGGRTALPSGSFDKYVLRFAYTGRERYTHDPVEWVARVSVDLEPGDWTVALDAYIGEDVSGQGSAAVTVSAGAVTPVTIRVGVNTGAGVQGTLKYRVSYPEAGPDHAYGTEVLNVRDTAGNPIGGPVTITNGAEGTLLLDAGVYFVDVMINDTVQQTGAARTSAAHIYGGQETYLEIEIGEEEFTALAPVTVTAGLTASPAIPVGRRWVTLYGDPLCTDPLDTAGTAALTGQAEVTLWAPSSKAGARVYVRQEISIGVATLSGHLEGVPMSVAGTEASLNDTLYMITVSNDTVHGTVQPNVPVAFPGNSITITAEEDPDAFFVDGTLMVLAAISSVTVSGSGASGSFTMPAEDVELYAEFHQFVRYGRAGGTGSGESWEDASDDVQWMMDELAALSAGYASDYAGPYIVKLGAGTYKPKYEPMVPSDPAELDDYEHNTPGDTRDKVFILRKGVQVRGGYVDGSEDIDEAERESRFNADGTVKLPIHQAILSGDIDGTPDSTTGSVIGGDLVFTGNAMNAYHVVLGVGTSAVPITDTTVLDGLTISGGFAGSSSPNYVDGVSISRNNGGGMYNHNASPKLNRVTIFGNTANVDGGGMYNYNGSSPNLTNIMISGNTTTTGAGGGMFNLTSAPVMSGGAIFGNTANGYGGGGIVNNGSSPTLSNVTISHNKANTGAGMFNHISPSPTLINVIISNNTANVVDGKGGGMYNEDSSPVMTNVTIGGDSSTDGNTAHNGGGIYNAGGSTLNITGVVKISGNEAANDGGGVYVSSGTFTMDGGTISGNQAAGIGGGVYVAGGTFTKTAAGIIYGDTDTTHTSGNDENTAASGLGHAVYVVTGPQKRNSTAGAGVALDSAISGPPGGWDSTSAYIQGKVNDVSANDSGSIVLLAGIYDMDSTVEIAGNRTITITTAQGAEVILKRNSGFDDHMIKVAGGALTLQTDTDGSLILDGDHIAAGGSLVRVNSGDLTMNAGVTLRNNQATGSFNQGGGVYFDGSAGIFTMNDGTISGNTASDGGGVYKIYGTFVMNGGTISDNDATSSGGGVLIHSGFFNMNGGTISGNDATSSGGGVLVGGITGTFTMTGGGIFNNVVTTGNGGGVFVEGYSGGPSAFNMTGGTIGGNAVTGNGGGVYVATNGIFTKTGTGSSIIYGDTNATHTSGSNENTAGSDHGHAVYVESGSQERNDNADFSVSLNSDTSDNWE